MTQGQKKTLGLAIASLVLGCFFWIPLLGLLFGLAALIMGIIALVQINKNKVQLKGEGMAIAGIVMGALSVLMIPFVALLAAIAIPNLLRARLNANEAMTQAQIRSVSTALEMYAIDNDAIYPVHESQLTAGDTPYLVRNYDGEVIGGYRYALRLTPSSYLIVAAPETCGASGNTIFKMTGPDGDIEKEPCAPPYRH